MYRFALKSNSNKIDLLGQYMSKRRYKLYDDAFFSKAVITLKSSE